MPIYIFEITIRVPKSYSNKRHPFIDFHHNRHYQSRSVSEGDFASCLDAEEAYSPYLPPPTTRKLHDSRRPAEQRLEPHSIAPNALIAASSVQHRGAPRRKSAQLSFSGSLAALPLLPPQARAFSSADPAPLLPSTHPISLGKNSEARHCMRLRGASAVGPETWCSGSCWPCAWMQGRPR